MPFINAKIAKIIHKTKTCFTFYTLMFRMQWGLLKCFKVMNKES